MNKFFYPLCFLIALSGLSSVLKAEDLKNPFADQLGAAPMEGSFKMKGYIIWGGSVVKGDDGRFYMFASRWLKSADMRNWVTNSEIVLASADKAEGPYEFEKVVLPPRGPEYWDGMMTHNPSIRRHEGKYILFYIGTTYVLERPTSMIDREVYGQVWNGKSSLKGMRICGSRTPMCGRRTTATTWLPKFSAIT